MTPPSHSSPAAVSHAPPSSRQRELGWNAPSNALCHRPRPRPGRRRRVAELHQNTGCSPAFSSRGFGSGLPWMSMQAWVIVVLLSVTLCCGQAEAGALHGHGRRGMRRGELFVDSREPPGSLMGRNEDGGRHGRGKGGSTSGSDDDELKLAGQGSQTPLPRPFDTNLGNNFTASSCPTFFNTFLTNATFNECLPFSLLLQTSNAFFTVSRSVPRLTSTLSATCAAPYPKCSALMSSLAQQIQQDSNCGADLRLENPMVTQAYDGFVAYAPLYQAGCLTSSISPPSSFSAGSGKGAGLKEDYCFADAVTNASAPTSSYIYYLALGVALPGWPQPACNSCLQRTMSIFAKYAGDSKQPLSQVYASAAQQLDMTCGPTFVEANVIVSSSAGTRSKSGRMGVVTAASLLGLWLGLF